ncbi:MAG: hypothetical protein BRC30_01305 [Nanohaloarchaea archaeon SW_7_46_7]|nr:MAG: hypothetical protein BRC30_01305 [Nanohaloarchaea archaeon SW_7_46_7]
MKKLCFLAFALLLIGSASATTINNHEVAIDLETSTVNVRMDISEMSSSAFYYTTSFPVTGSFTAKADGEQLECERQDLPPGSYITCDTERKNLTINMEYTTEGLVTQREGVNIFRYSQAIQRPTDSYSLKVLLPQGSGLIESSNVSLPVISPESGVSGTDGQRIHVTWNSDPGLGQRSFQAIFNGSGEEESREDDGIDLVWIFPILVVSMLFAGLYVLFRSREDIDSAYDELSEDEADVLDTVRENDNSMLQKDIVDESEYSKAKISSVISELEEKGIVKKSKEGRSNKISISRKYRY